MKGWDPSRDMLNRILLLLLTHSTQCNKVVINPKCLVARTTYLYYMGIAVQDNEKSVDYVSSAKNKTEFPEIRLCEW